MAMVGYARVSTPQQKASLQAQVEQLRALGCIEVFTDIASGARADRDGLEDALKYVRKGDILTVTKLDRLGRSLSHAVTLLEDLSKRGVKFQATDLGIDTSSDLGAAFMNVVLVFAEMERSLIRERTQAGLARAREQGRAGGRPQKLTPSQRRAALAALKDGMTAREVAEVYGVSRWTIQRLTTAEK